MKVRFLDELEMVMKKYGLDCEDFCVAASAALAYEDVRENKDLDIVIKPKVRECFLEKYRGQVEVLPSGAINLSENVQAAYQRYQKVGVTDEELFCDAYVIRRGAFQTVKPEVEIAQKIKRNKEKDKLDLGIMGYDFFERPDFDMDMFEKLAMAENSASNNICRDMAEKEKKTSFQMEEVCVMPIGALLHRGYGVNGFQRYDILALAYLLSHWREDIEKEIDGSMIDERKILLAERELRQGKRRYFEKVKIREDGMPDYGAIELSKAICRQDEYVKIKVGNVAESKEFSFKWIQERNEALAKKIEDYREKIFREYGVYFCAIVWGPAVPYADEISEKIERKFKVSGRKSMTFQENEYCDFIKEIYDIDDVDCWKTVMKIEHLKQYSHKAEIIIFEIPFPNFREKWRDGSYLSDEGAKLKREIREEFKKYIPGYKKDIIIHIGDNHMHNAYMMKTVEMWGGKI